MSFIHYLFLGHFERDSHGVRFSKSPSDPAYRPVVSRPIDSAAITAVLRAVRGAGDVDLALPDDWMIWMKDGYLACEKYTRDREALAFVTRLVERTHCEIYDVSARADMSLRDWLAVTRSYAKP